MAWGTVGDNIARIFDQLNYETTVFFRHTVDWQLKLSQRYPEPGFGLLVLALRPKLANAAPEAMMAKLAGIIGTLLRNTDLCTQTEPGVLWLLLPHTTAAGVENYRTRLADSWDAMAPDFAFDATFVWATYGSDQGLPSTDAQQLMAATLRSMKN